MAEHAISYVIALAIVCNVTVMLGLGAIVLLVPRTTRRRPAHRAETAPLRTRVTLIPARPTRARAARAITARVA